MKNKKESKLKTGMINGPDSGTRERIFNPFLPESVKLPCRLFTTPAEVDRVIKYAQSLHLNSIGLISEIERDVTLPDRAPDKYSGKYEILLIEVGEVKIQKAKGRLKGAK